MSLTPVSCSKVELRPGSLSCPPSAPRRRSYPAVNRYSSSSLSSQASNEVSNITGQSESSDEVFNMQVPSLHAVSVSVSVPLPGI